MSAKLSAETARSIQPGQVLRCAEVNGLQLIATKTGVSWMLYYRAADGTQRRPKLGAYPEISIADARKVAKDWKVRIAKGEDPSLDRRSLREAPRVDDLCNRYLNDWAPLAITLGQLSERHRAENERLIETYIRPGLGKLKVQDVTRAHVDDFLRDVFKRRFTDPRKREKKLQRQVGKATAPSTANHVRTLLRQLFNLARKKFGMSINKVDGAPLNPVEDSIHFAIDKRRRKAERHEIQAIAVALRCLEETHPRHAACIWTILLTGGRVNEIVRALKDERQGYNLVKFDHKTKRYIGEKSIFLPTRARELLDALPNDPTTDRLFGDIGIRDAWDTVRRNAGCPDLQLLDLRRTFASYALDAGASLDQIGQMLGHSNAQTTRGYAWLTEGGRSRVGSATAETILQIASEPSRPDVETLMRDLG